MQTSRILALGGFAAFAAMSVEARGAETLLEALRGLAPSSIVSERIVGGDPTSQNEWPWQNALYFRSPDGHQYFDCGGSLIAPNWVLTAAHCFAGTRKPEDWTVVTNIAKISADGIPEGSLQRKVARVVVHEQYDTESHANDIALLQLAEPLPNTTISLQLTGDKTIEGADRSVTVIGWGRTRWLQQKKDAQGNSVWIDGMTQQQVNPSNFQSPELRKASIPLVDLEKCAKMEQGIKGVVVDARVLCAGLPEGNRDFCQGDSGGPLMTQIDSDHWRQIGVVSVGLHCGEVKLPGVYTRVSAFGDWIRGVVGGDCGRRPNALAAWRRAADLAARRAADLAARRAADLAAQRAADLAARRAADLAARRAADLAAQRAADLAARRAADLAARRAADIAARQPQPRQGSGSGSGPRQCRRLDDRLRTRRRRQSGRHRRLSRDHAEAGLSGDLRRDAGRQADADLSQCPLASIADGCAGIDPDGSEPACRRAKL